MFCVNISSENLDLERLDDFTLKTKMINGCSEQRFAILVDGQLICRITFLLEVIKYMGETFSEVNHARHFGILAESAEVIDGLCKCFW